MKVGKSSECCAAMHPDMVMDSIADSIVDLALSKNKNSRCGIEGIVATDEVIVRGEVGGIVLDPDEVDLKIREVVSSLGYVGTKGFDAKTLKTNIRINSQSSDIAMGVVNENGTNEKGWGDQGIFFGYACSDTDLALPIHFVIPKELMALHSFSSDEDRRSWGIQPDAKCQFTLSDEGKNTLVISVSHLEGADVKGYVDSLLEDFLNEYPYLDSCIDNCDFLINPTGNFVIMGPHGDCGTVGRKLTATTYGGVIPIGGGAMCGKDPSKSDRSLQYMARYLARKSMLAFDLDEVMVSLSCAIGKPEPTSITVTGKNIDSSKSAEISRWIIKNFDLTPNGVIRILNLKNIKYAPTALNGHFGISKFMPEAMADSSFTWEL